jgi:uncharacterized protein YcfJ
VSISHELEKTMKKLIAVSLASAALIAAMSTPARADHGATVIGAVIGGTVGTVIGQDFHGRRGAVIGAAIGAATGATIGYDVGQRHRERVEYEQVYYPEPVYRQPPPEYRPRPVERIVYVPVEEARPYPRDYDRCDHDGWKRHHHRHHWDRDERRRWD